jgi:predicted amidohydrolase
MQCDADRERDLATASQLIGQAADQGADLVVLPELFASLGPGHAMRAGAESMGGNTVSWAGEQAKRHSIWLVAGSFVEQASTVGERGDRLFNTSPLLAPNGELVATYRKVHLFDVDVEGAGMHESDVFTAGDALVAYDIDDTTLGLTTCYDLRFPEQFRLLALAGASVVAMPSAFTAATGAPQWEPLARARAIENQVFLIAPDQCGTSPDGIARHGHSMIVGPWGEVLATAGEDEAVIVADLDLSAVERARRSIPNLANRRPDVYTRFG